MLNESKLNQFFDHLHLSDEARAIIRHIRASSPVRRVRSSAKNVAVRYTSHKMGVVIQAESYKNEFAAVYEFEHDDEVLEFYDQPSRMKLTYRSAQGKPVGVWHTPDYFLICKDEAGWVECKTEEELAKLSQTMPHRYVADGQGGWRCPPGEEYANPLGLFYRVRSSATIDWVFYRNATFLDDYWRAAAEDLAVAEAAETEVLEAVVREPGLSLGHLLQQLQTARSDDVYMMLVKGQIYVDLRAYPLAEPERAPVFRDQWIARAHVILPDTMAETTLAGMQDIQVAVGELITWAGSPWRIINLSDAELWLRFEREGGPANLVRLTFAEFRRLVDAGEIKGVAHQLEPGLSAEARDILVRASPEDLQRANHRYRLIVEPILQGKPALDTSLHPRTVDRYVANFKKAQAVHQCGYVGLIDHVQRRGNHLTKIPDETRALMLKFIAEAYEDAKQPTKLSVYRSFSLACQRQGLQPCSAKTFNRTINLRPKEGQTRRRQGRKAGDQLAAFYWELAYTTPRHGERPFEIGHIDHTRLNLEMLHSTTLKNLGHCWVTFLMDAFTRFLLALYLSYDPPSYRSCMMVLRDCVRRHGRLPQMIVSDRGSEFGSLYYETLLARYECTKKERPAGQPRYGSVIERLFDTSQTQFIYNLTGNTQMMLGDLRQLSREVDPKSLANWTLPRLYPRFCQWADLYNRAEHGALGQSPQEAMAAGLALGGERRHRLIPYNQDFIVDSMPTSRKGTAKVDLNRGVKVNSLYYWNDAFRHPAVGGCQVPVRYDPMNVGLAYAYVQDRWVQCISEHYARLNGRSEKVLKLAAEELRARNRRHTRQLPMTGRWLAELIEELEREEQYFELFGREADNQQVILMAEGNLSTLPAGQVSVAAATRVVEQGEPESADDRGAHDPVEAFPVFTL